MSITQKQLDDIQQEISEDAIKDRKAKRKELKERVKKGGTLTEFERGMLKKWNELYGRE